MSGTPAALRSPDVHALIWRQIQSVARLDVEGRVPGVDIPHDSVGAVFRRTVGIGDQLLTQGALAGLGLPPLRVPEEEALVAAQAVDDGGFAVLGLIPLERSVRGLDATEVADVLAQRQPALDVRARHR